MQVTFYFAGESTQVLDALPWVRCASGNVFIHKALILLTELKSQMLDKNIARGTTDPGY